MRSHGPMQRGKRRNRLARSLAVALVTSIGTAMSGCALINPPEQVEQKPPAPKPAPVKATAVITPEQRAEASALHAAAIEQMGRGAIGPATTNLALAAKLDPTNERIKRDLVRANRMRSAIGQREVPPRRGVDD